jgi:hypothetical protein
MYERVRWSVIKGMLSSSKQNSVLAKYESVFDGKRTAASWSELTIFAGCLCQNNKVRTDSKCIPPSVEHCMKHQNDLEVMLSTSLDDAQRGSSPAVDTYHTAHRILAGHQATTRLRSVA